MIKKSVIYKHIGFLTIAILAVFAGMSQEQEKLVTVDSLTTTTQVTDTSDGVAREKIKVYNPKVATFRSAVLPGWGQIYNKKYWKLPIVYGTLGVCAGVFVYNLKNYKDTRFAYKAKYNASLPGATAADSALLLLIDPKLQRLSAPTLKYYRDEFRRGVDYSVLLFILAWGLNVVDATVDAHLKAFDVSPDLSLRIVPGHSQMAGTNGISLVLAFR